MSKVGPQRMIEHFKECHEDFVQAEEKSALMPPIVKIPKNIEFLFCIVRELGEEMEEFAQPGSVNESALINCCNDTEY